MRMGASLAPRRSRLRAHRGQYVLASGSYENPAAITKTLGAGRVDMETWGGISELVVFGDADSGGLATANIYVCTPCSLDRDSNQVSGWKCELLASLDMSFGSTVEGSDAVLGRSGDRFVSSISATPGPANAFIESTTGFGIQTLTPTSGGVASFSVPDTLGRDLFVDLKCGNNCRSISFGLVQVA